MAFQNVCIVCRLLVCEPVLGVNLEFLDVYISNLTHSLSLSPSFFLSVDYDPQVVEQKELAPPASLPLSYVLRYISDDARKEPSTFLINNTSSNSNSNSASNNGSSGNVGNAELKRKLAIKHHSYSMSSSNRSNTPTGKKRVYNSICLADSYLVFDRQRNGR